MNDQHNINNNQNTYRNGQSDDTYSRSTYSGEPNTRVLSDDERREFDGVTIEEVGDSVHVNSTPTNINDEQQYYDENNQYEPKVKVYSFNRQAGLVELYCSLF